MKHPKKRFVSVLLAVAMVITCFLSFGGVSAAAIAHTRYYNAVYYFYDSHPTAKQCDLEACVTADSLIFDGQPVTEEEFYDLIDTGYFNAVEPASLVIMDIKSFKPDVSELCNLLFYFRSLGCDIVLIATYTQSEYTNSSLDDCVDMYFEANLGQMELFVRGSLDMLLDTLDTFNNQVAGTCILIDGNMVDEELIYSDVAWLCMASPFFRILLLELALRLNILQESEMNNNFSAENYDLLFDTLHNNYNISFLVHVSNDVYCRLGVNGGNNLQPTTITDLQTTLAPSGTHFCAFGFWTLPSSFYTFLYDGQQLLGDDNLPMFVYEIESAEYSESGLSIHLEEYIAEGHRDHYENLYQTTYDERERFLEAFTDLMEVLE